MSTLLPRSRRFAVRAGRLTAVAASTAFAPMIVTDSAHAATVSTTFVFTGTMQSFLTPPAICSVTITADGGHGGMSSGGGNPGGAAAAVTAHVPVTPGSVLTVLVAGAGAPGGPNGSDGGFGGGGSAGFSENGSGGGGGASVVATSTDALVVAGGGGGAAEGPRANGHTAVPPGSISYRGDGTSTGDGGEAGAGVGAGGGVGDGGVSPPTPPGRSGGSGGRGVGGVGGGGGGTSNGFATMGDGGAGNGSGGDGGDSAIPGSQSDAESGGVGGTGTGTGGANGGGGGGVGFGGGGASAGGGGGGGYGGGGGASGFTPGPEPESPGGGGGGSSFVTAAATILSSGISSRTGAGQVTISYDPLTDSCTSATTPVAADDAYSTTEDISLNVAAPGVLGNDRDPDGGSLSAVVVSGPVHGTLVLRSDGSFTYTPAADYNGPDSFTYTASDGINESNVATVSLTVTPVSDAPIADDDAYSVGEDLALNMPSPGVLGNDRDPDGAGIHAVLVSEPSHSAGFELRGDGSFSYAPVANYNGPDSFTYRASDGIDVSRVATVSLTVTPENDPPSAGNDTYTIGEDTALVVPGPGVLGNDGDPDGDTLSAVLVSEPSHSAGFELRGDGSFTYTPAANYHGPDSFTYKATDGTTDSNAATVSITVSTINDPPAAAADAYTTAEDTALTVAAPGVLGNDSDPDGGALSAVLVSGPAHGTLVLRANGSFTYTPAANYHGPDSFTYKANDGTTDSNAATVSITVTAANDILFASSRTGNGDIYVVTPNGSGPTQLSSGPAIDAEPAWSPNHTKIAFSSSRTGSGDIYAMNANGTNPTQLTTHSADDASPAWSPDGTKIAFASNRSGNWDIYVMNANGTAQTRLTTNSAADTVPTWSPDGTKLAFSSTRTGGGDIYVMNANGTAQTRLTTASGIDTEPAWSPDGTKIAFATNRDGNNNFEIYTMAAAGAGQTRLTTQTGHDFTPTWSPDGTRIAFATTRTGNLDIYTMSATGTGQTTVVTHPAVDAFPDW
jgi:hypothetical protein